MNYCTINFPKDLIDVMLRKKEQSLKDSTVNDGSGVVTRNSKISWIKD